MREITEIVIHCTDTRPKWWAERTPAEKVAEVRRWHVEDRGWSDIGYHFLIDRDGTVVEGRPVERTGAHVQGHNTGTIGVSLFGGHGGAATDDFLDNFTEDQERALQGLISKLRGEHPSITKISGHNQYANKACPCFSVPAWLEGARGIQTPPAVDSGRSSIAKSTTVQATVVQVASAAGAGITAVSALDGTAQLVLIGCLALVVVSAMWIFKERIKKWSRGVR